MNLMPSEIIDAHHHLWDLDALSYPWLMAKGVKRFFGDPSRIQQNYLIDNYMADSANTPLTHSVHVQVGANPEQAIDETRWLQSIATSPDSNNAHNLPSAIVAYVDLSSPSAANNIAAHKVYPNLRGVRQIVGRSHKEDAKTGTSSLLDDPQWKEGLSLLAKSNLSFDLQLIPSQFKKVVKILEEVPELKVNLCHCGSPSDRSLDGIAMWREGMILLSKLPNVCCKISGLGMYDHHWTVNSIRPIVLETIDIFGPNRCMFGSNFPVDKLYSSYTDLWSAFGQITSGFSTSERRLLFSDTARKFYRI